MQNSSQGRRKVQNLGGDKIIETNKFLCDCKMGKNKFLSGLDGDDQPKFLTMSMEFDKNSSK